MRPAVDTPTQWRHQPGIAAAEIDIDWWSAFGSPELNALMFTALEHNNDLRASLQRIEQSRAGLRVAGASLLPAIDTSNSISWTRTNPPDSKTASQNAWRGSIGIAYEADLFGANRANVAAARASLAGTLYDHQALALVVTGDVASTYFNLLNLRERVEIAESNLKNAHDILRIVQARFDAGAVSAIDLSRQKTSIATTEANLATLKQQALAAENALSVLLGKPPQDLGLMTQNLKNITIPEISPAQPSSLLDRRPDIRSAESGLIAANADIGAARAAFYPSLSLSNNGSVSAAIGDPVTTAISIAASMAMTIFSGGQLEGTLDRTKARQAELSALYGKAVLTAFLEAENAMSAAIAAQKRQQSFNTALNESRKTYTLSKQLYDAGSTDFEALLNAQSTLLGAQDSAASTKLESINAAIDLYKALGGGWK
jgi:NodT family efflux transporter outer membrane factor (OMF) lipoprotein